MMMRTIGPRMFFIEKLARYDVRLDPRLSRRSTLLPVN